MKKVLFVCFSFLFCLNCFAQQTIAIKGRIYNKFTEKYNVLADSPKLKHGLYQALYNKKIAVASGQYTRGKRTGLWHFYNIQGTPIQNYNYNTNTLLYESAADTVRGIKYFVDGNIDSIAKTTRPIKPGGVYFGYLPYISQFIMPKDLSDADPEYFGAVVELLVSPGGRLADYKIRVVSPDGQYNKVADMDMNFLTEEDKRFIPATINNQPVAVTIYIPCRITASGRLEYQ
ncbi:hypothetical protein EOD41_12180 [Mucilaginibacter limnophilus]|uniref:TonB C-terminal domain-containing protein n=1 Tax=Mucilaginibacter limnophilus TaxID=1932778 RepID=A0A3S2V1J1_9SPHI|nr:hypothetical protein [Mucilaginibacter limnophilus]RVU00743.1 hypothetical protein EOD41_12180 [Mucilaginibacter limnophilus]